MKKSGVNQEDKEGALALLHAANGNAYRSDPSGSSKNGLSTQIHSEIERVIDDLTLFDDDLMSKVFDGNIEAAELLLKIVLQRDDIRAIRVKGQVDMKSPYVKGRDITLDIHVVDGDGTEFDVEVQKNVEGSHNRRTRFHGSMMDVRMLKKREKFKALKDAYIIFILYFTSH